MVRARAKARPRQAALRSINPATGELLETFKETGKSDLARILEGADRA